MARFVLFHRMFKALLISALVLVPARVAGAWQAIAHPPDAQFQQAARQQQVTDQLQKRQLEQQLHQSVSQQAKKPASKNTNLQRQLEQADQAQHSRDRAAQQDLVDRYRNQVNSLPRVIPQDAPASSRSGN